MKPRSSTFTDVPLKMVGSSVYGRYPKISVERTFNMIISDDWLADYAGYQKVIAALIVSGAGRGIYHSVRLNLLFVAMYNGIFAITSNLIATQVGKLNTYEGDVFFAEDTQTAGHIAICDKTNMWIYTHNPFSFSLATGGTSGTDLLDFLPGYVSYHNGRFLSVDLNSATWRLSDPANGNTRFPNASQFVGGFQTKSDQPIAVLPVPGKGNLILVMGRAVTELWMDVGAQLFSYQRATGVNIDYGCINPDTIAALDNIICWLGINERAGLGIMVSTGGEPTKISTDGIDFLLQQLTAPTDSHAFMFRQDGHIIYQVVFPTDNVSFIYDFNTQKFFDVTDTYMNFHPAKRVAFFNNKYYFVSLKDTALYEMGTIFTTYDGNQIPRVRVCNTTRLPDTTPFVVNNLSFPIEQGVNNDMDFTFTGDQLSLLNGNFLTLLNSNSFAVLHESRTLPVPIVPVVDISFSNDGGYQFSNYDRMSLNSFGNRRNLFVYYSLSWCNEFTPQFRFFSQGRFVVGNGTLSIYQ